MLSFTDLKIVSAELLPVSCLCSFQTETLRFVTNRLGTVPEAFWMNLESRKAFSIQSVCFRWLFKARCLRPTEGAKRGLGGPNDCLSITDLSSQRPESSGLSTQSHRLSLGFRADPRVNINFLMHFLSLGGDSPENHSAGSPNRIEWRGECVTLHFSS